MRLALRFLIVALLSAFVSGSASAQTYSAVLDGLQETPPNASPGSGTALLTLDAAKMLTVHVDYCCLVGGVTAAHIHSPAPAGVPAGVRFGLIPPAPASSPIDVVVGPLNATDEANLNNGLMYINIHSPTFPGGEIRGQISGPLAVRPETWGLVKDLYRD